MQKAWSTLIGLAVQTEDAARPLGLITGLFLHPDSGQIIGYKVGFGSVVSPSDIVEWHRGSVTISEEEALQPLKDSWRLQEYGPRRCNWIGKKVLSRSGKSMGQVQDLFVNLSTSNVMQFEVAKGFLMFRWDRRIFPLTDVQEVTDNAIILNVEPNQKTPERVPQGLVSKEISLDY